MDFLDYMKEKFWKSYPPTIKIIDGKIYENSYFTGFSISQKENYSSSAIYDVTEKILGSETPTNYQLEYNKSLNLYKILRFHSDTGYEIRHDGIDPYSWYSLYYQGTRFAASSLDEKEAETEEEEKTESEEMSSSVSSSNNYSDLFDGFWSWKSWGTALLYILGFTFSGGGLLVSMISPWLLLIGPGILVLWAILIVLHNLMHR